MGRGVITVEQLAQWLLQQITQRDALADVHVTQCVQVHAPGFAQVLEGRRAKLSTHLRSAREIFIDARSNTQNQDRYRLALMEHAMATTESDIAWIDGLVATERRVGSAN